MLRDHIMTLAALMAEYTSADEQTIVEHMVAHGHTVLQAELLVAFAPLGLARPLISRLGIDPPIHLPDVALIRVSNGKRMLEVRLTDVPEFVTAFELGEETFLTGVIPRDQFRAASSISVELNLISQALNAEKSLSGAKMSPPILLRLADAPGFKQWYKSVKPKKRGWVLSW